MPLTGQPNMRSQISAERLSDFIGRVYDCVIAPEKWGAVIDAIRLEFSFANAVIGVNALPAGRVAIHATAGMDQRSAAQMASFSSEEVLENWGGPARIRHHPLGEPIIQSQATNRAAWAYARWYNEWCKPQGLIDAVAIPVARDPTMVGSLAFGRHESAGEISEAEMSGLRLISPHVRRAVTISKLFDLKAVEVSTFASTIEAFAAGVVLVDENLAIVHANTAATAMLAGNDPILSRQGRLGLRHRAANGALEVALFQAVQDETRLGQRGIAIPARRENGEPCVLHVLPLGRGEIRPGLVQRAAAVLFVAPASSPPRLPTDSLVLLYDLTPAEARIFELSAMAARRRTSLHCSVSHLAP
jgi:PAS domain-containing protein